MTAAFSSPSSGAWPATLVLVVVVPGLLGVGCERGSGTGSGSAAGRAIVFSEVSEAAGLGFAHRNGASGSWYFPEIMGSGVIVFDHDGDGDDDVYLIQSGPLPGKSYPDASHNRLFRRDDGMRFVDVTESAGVGDGGYGMGGAAGDIDGDGDLDLLVTNFGPNVLYENVGDGRFVDITAAAGIAGGAQEWSTSAAFLDHDGDGDLDLYVVNYVDFTLEDNKVCVDHGYRDYCTPAVYAALPDRLYRNDGRGRFEDVSQAAGISAPDGKGLGIATCDHDGDGDVDIYIANDGTQNHLYVNQGDGTFVESGFFSGVGFNERGAPEAGMGVDFGDVDNDGDFDAFVTNLDYETHTLYLNEGTSGFFSDATANARLVEPTIGRVGFGALLLDLDLDGHLDLYIANGHVLAQIESHSHLQYAQPDQVFRGLGGVFEDVSVTAGPYFASRGVGRGLAAADLDGDGDFDLVVTENDGPVRLLRNDSAGVGSWIGFRVRSRTGNTHGIGCRVELRAGGASQLREIRSGSSYLSQSSLVAHFGLGDARRVEEVVVRWPDGHRQQYGPFEADRYHTLERAARP